MDQGARLGERTRRFAHEVVFYDGDAGRARALLPFVRDGVERGEPVLVVLPATSIGPLREQLGGAAGQVVFADMAEVGANPARIIPVWRRFVDEHGARGPVRGVGEPVWAGRRDAEIVEAQLHEALLNLAFDEGVDLQLLCPYDTGALPGWVIEEARRTHPLVLDPGQRSTRYAGARYAQEAFGRTLPPAPRSAHRFPFRSGDLSAVRDRVRRAGAQAGLAGAVADDLVLATHELATNSVIHADGEGLLVLWADPEALCVEIRDSGRIEDPLVGRSEPDAAALGGRGIWMVNQLCDLVQVRSGRRGTQVRLYAWL